MTRSRLRFLVVSIVLGGLFAAGTWFTAAARRTQPDPDSLFKHLSVFTEVLGLVQQAYVEDTSTKELMTGAFEGSMDALDPFSVYVPAGDVQRYLDDPVAPIPLSGAILIKERGWLYVAGVVDGSESQRIGLQRGDLLSRIDGELTREQPVWAIQQQLADPRRETLQLEVIRRGETVAIEMEIASPTETPAVSRTDEREVPILRISRFDGNTAATVAEVLTAIDDEGRDRLILDLRRVAGGDPLTAFEVADLFVVGELGRLIRKGETETVYESTRDQLWLGRVVVLVDRGTLGAAEVLAATLVEVLEADLVGERTFGYAGRRTAVELSDGGLLIITNAFFAPPSGQAVSSGLTPSVRVSERSRRLSESDQTLDDLILARGLDLLLDEAEAEAEAAA